MADDNNDDDRPGYRKPPRHSQWKPGQSGNPGGRPKGSRGLKTDLHAELVSKMEIQINGKRISGTKQQLMLKTLTARAAAGDIRAIGKLIDLILEVFGSEDRGGERAALSPGDQQLLDELLGGAAAEEPLGETAEEPPGEPNERLSGKPAEEPPAEEPSGEEP